ncbi:phosphomannomutase/phosphoglucomutase [Thiomicrospira sp. R3]|uniref:phosphomannomutase/phosphoglucomutase n=1 Tax=Thiomicrospira sp. R3 TaxID=3035472 RepID=UPI00259B6BCF|nr:phosphomannomutase/phosphoglucomutase [Thiomicrospira sp. R3]WFE68738.1 phosphomannomutase/phosphoglucomutase [Thiomicrospira sp. R3]
MDAEQWLKLQNGSDIRGIALNGIEGETVNLDEDRANCIGQAFAVWLSQRLSMPFDQLRISVGRDSRISGPMLSQSLCEGLMARQARVTDFGLASTPAMFVSTISNEQSIKPSFHGAIMITASHLPFNRNGFKFFTDQGGLEKQDITKLLTLASSCISMVCENKSSQLDFMAVYAAGLVEKVRRGIEHAAHYQAPLSDLKILVDAGNGAGGFFVDRVLKPLGADTTGSQFLEPDGRFPNHVPNPEDAAAMQSIRDAVLTHQADFGIIFDTDVDRSAAVDHQGQTLNRNRLIALISAILIRQHPGSTIVTDSITSDGLTDFIEIELKGKHHRFKRGYKNVINEAIRLNQQGVFSPLAIETSGHAALKENHFLDDGAYLITKLLIELAKAKLNSQTLGDLISGLKEPVEDKEIRYRIEQENFQLYGQKVLDELKQFVIEQGDWIEVPKNHEGVRVKCNSVDEQGWFLLRLSLHDPVLALNVESNIQGGSAAILKKLTPFISRFNYLVER